MDVELVKEHEDGSATFIITTNKEETENLIEYAILNLLNDYIERNKSKNE